VQLDVDRSGDIVGGALWPPSQHSEQERLVQRFEYEWDEVGRLVRARRFDAQNPEAIPTNLQAELTFTYDASDQRVRKTSGDSYTLYVFASLELRRAAFEAGDYTLSEATEVPYLFANGVRLGRVVHDVPPNDYAGQSSTRVFLELGDHLGSTSVVLDRATGELVQRSTAYAYGEVESSLRPGRWEEFREDYRFTGKEDDVEVGLIYFGKRFYAPLLQRWISPDPLAIHAPGQADLNLYAYVHGKVLVAVDPVGLAEPGSEEHAAALNYFFPSQTVQPPRSTPSAAPTGGAADAGAPCGGTSGPDGPDGGAAPSSSGVHEDVDGLSLEGGMTALSALSATFWLDWAASDATTRFDAGVGPTESPPGGTDYSAGVEGGLLADPAMRFATGVAIDFMVGAAVSELLLGRAATKVPEHVGVGCFVAGTTVWSQQGPKAIESVKSGDVVLAMSEEGPGVLRWARVLDTYKLQPSTIVDLVVTDGNEFDVLGVTPLHPFWRKGTGWVEARKLACGDGIWSAARGWLVVQGVNRREGVEPVYNLHVEKDHSYFVGQLAAWVHNDSTANAGLIQGAAEGRQEIGTLHDFRPPAGSARRPGHARSSHGWGVDHPVILETRNRPSKLYVGTNEHGNQVAVFYKDGNVVITDLADTQSVITAYGKDAPKRASFVADKWKDDPLFHLVE
jgi:RHS repeat-associated protein